MDRLLKPIGRIPFLAQLTAVNSLILLASVLAFAFLPTGAGHVLVLAVMAALLGWWLSLHARRFAGAGKGLGWPAGMALVAFLTFAFCYAAIAALWAVPEVQQEAFRTGGSDYTKHVETSAALLEAGRLLSGWLGAAGAVALAGFLAMAMGAVALASGVVSLVALMLPSAGSRAPARILPARRG